MSTSTEWTVLERLLLAQAVNKYGEDSWSQVARTLKQHPLLQDHAHPDEFNQKNCSLQYYLMIETFDSESAQTENTNPTTQDMPKVVKLARQLYFQRVEELKRIINQDEDRFVTLLAEIDDIKSGTASTRINEEQASPTKAENDMKPVAEIDTIVQESSPDKDSTLLDTGMEETEKPIVDNGNNMNSHQQALAPMDISTTENETATDHMIDGTQRTTTEQSDLEATEKMQVEPTTTVPVDTGDTSITNLEQPGHKHTDSEAITETPAANETLTPPPPPSPSPPPASANDELTTELPLTGTKRSSSDITSTGIDLDQHTTSETSPKRQKLDQPDVTRSPSFITPAQSVDDQMEANSVDEDKTPEADQIETGHVEANQLPETTATTMKSPPPPSSTTTGTSLTEPSSVSKAESPATNIGTDDSGTNTPVLVTEIGEGEEEGDNLSVSLKDADGAESVTGSDSNAATPSATTTATSEKRRSVSGGNIKDDPRQKSWQKNVNLLWREIANHKNGAMFMNPIKEAQAPLYYDVVKYPLDLKTIKNRIRDGIIRTTVEFERDVVLMLTNSLMYNKEGTEIYQMAHEMLQDVMEQIKIFKTADGNSSAHIKGTSILSKGRRKSLAE